MEENSWRSNHGGEVMEDESWREIMEEISWEKNLEGKS